MQHTFEQHPPKIRASIPPAASHCGIVSMMMRPARAMKRFEAGRGSSMPYISAFSSDGAALMTFGTTRPVLSEAAEAWRSRRTAARRRGIGMDDDDDGGEDRVTVEAVVEVAEGADARALFESVLRLLAI